MPNFKILSPATVRSPVTVFGRTYSGAPGTLLDVGASDAEALCLNGWLSLGQSGTTAQRPSTRTEGAFVAQAGSCYWDTSLNAWLVHDGAVWRDSITGAAA